MGWGSGEGNVTRTQLPQLLACEERFSVYYCVKGNLAALFIFKYDF